MAQQSSNSAGTSAGKGQKRRDTFLALVILGFLLLGILWGLKLGWFTDNSISETQARSGMYRMYDLTDESPEGAPNREKFVQVRFTADSMSFEYPVILKDNPATPEDEDGLEATVIVGGNTVDGRTYILRHRRSDQDQPSSARWQCTFEARTGLCLVPNIEGGTNRVEFTQQ